MVAPALVMAWHTGRWPQLRELPARVMSVQTLMMLGVYMVFVLACAAHEIVRAWRRVIQLLT